MKFKSSQSGSMPVGKGWLLVFYTLLATKTISWLLLEGKTYDSTLKKTKSLEAVRTG